jgi:hypothetical protein
MGRARAAQPRSEPVLDLDSMVEDGLATKDPPLAAVPDVRSEFGTASTRETTGPEPSDL